MKIYGVHHNPNDEDNELYVITEYVNQNHLIPKALKNLDILKAEHCMKK
jgi:hypothetical protein